MKLLICLFVLSTIHIIVKGEESKEHVKECPDLSNCTDTCLLRRMKDSYGCEICNECILEGVLESDILVDNTTYDALHRRYFGAPDKIQQRGLQNNQEKKWPKFGNFVEIGYIFDRTISRNKGNNIRKAMEKFHQNTCIRFVEKSFHPDYLNFHSGGGCSSYVGRRGGRQLISIGRNCDRREGTIIHEIMHALGFYHEQSRGDRDNYITVILKNARSGTEINFRKQKDWNSLGSPYDTGSVMHYGGFYFARNRRLPTIVDKQNKPIQAQRIGFSTEDIHQINLFYNCKDYLPRTENTFKPNTTPPKTTTSVTTTRIVQKCINQHSACQQFLDAGYCGVAWVKERCMASCNLCAETAITFQPTTSTEPLTTTMTTSEQFPTSSSATGGNNCYDKSKISCQYWKQKGYCKNENYKNSLQSYCPESCGYCKTTTATIQTTCTDKYSACNDWAKQNYCNQSSFVKKNCLKSCTDYGLKGLCNSGNIFIQPSPATTTSSCIDKNESCSFWKQSNLCSNDHYRTFMRNHCAKTCGYCR